MHGRAFGIPWRTSPRHHSKTSPTGSTERGNIRDHDLYTYSFPYVTYFIGVHTGVVTIWAGVQAYHINRLCSELLKATRVFFLIRRASSALAFHSFAVWSLVSIYGLFSFFRLQQYDRWASVEGGKQRTGVCNWRTTPGTWEL